MPDYPLSPDEIRRSLELRARAGLLEKRRDRIVDLRNMARHRERTWIDERLEVMLVLVDAEIIELTGEPTPLTEEEEIERRVAAGIEDGIDTRRIPPADVRDIFNPTGALKPWAYRRPLVDRHRYRCSLPEALLVRVRLHARSPRSRSYLRARTARGDPSEPDDESDDLGRSPFGGER